MYECCKSVLEIDLSILKHQKFALSCPSSPMGTGHTPKKKPPPIAPKPRVSWTHSLPTTDLNYQLTEDPSSFSQVQVICFSNFDRCSYYASHNIQRAIHECNSNLSSQQKIHIPVLIIMLYIMGLIIDWRVNASAKFQLFICVAFQYWCMYFRY